MYYHRVIINFRKLSSGNEFFLHVLINIPNKHPSQVPPLLPLGSSEINVFPRQFLGTFMIAYGIVGTFSNIDPDEVYDYHTAFDIHPTEVVYNVDINTNQKVIKNVKLDKSVGNSVATVAIAKELIHFTTNNIYRQYFEEFYDFGDSSNCKQSTNSSGVSFNGVNPNFIFPTKNIDKIVDDGLRVDGYGCTITVPHSRNFTICFVIKPYNKYGNLRRVNINNFLLTFFCCEKHQSENPT